MSDWIKERTSSVEQDTIELITGYLAVLTVILVLLALLLVILFVFCALYMSSTMTASSSSSSAAAAAVSCTKYAVVIKSLLNGTAAATFVVML
jgi:hypothetical protein